MGSRITDRLRSESPRPRRIRPEVAPFCTGDYSPIMRFLAALALLLQLQPLAGSALCFHDAEVAKAECSMPHEERPTGSTFTVQTTQVPGGCPSMGYCAPAAPTVPEFAEHFQITSFVHGDLALVAPSMAPGESLTPPFHPPKA